jgi:hypothetical protein
MKGFKLSRRAALRGLGASVALPFLDVMRGANARAQATRPLRAVFFYVPCGIDMATFRPATTGPLALSRMLQPLESLREKTLVVSGVENFAANDQGDGPGDHARGTGAFLTGVHPLKAGGAIQNGISIDQVIANHYRGQTALPSLELGCEGGAGTGDCDSGYSCAYTRNIAWTSPTLPLPKEVNPRAAFDRLFAAADAGLTEQERQVRRRRRLSILDAVKDDTARLHGRLGVTDRRKLDDYLSGVRELELRVEDATLSTCSFPDKPQGADQNPDAYVRQMLDLIVLAARCDLTRVASFMMGNGGSNRSFGFLGHPGGHHEYSHHQGNEANLQALADIGRWEVGHFAYLAQQLDAIDDGDGTALDNTVMFLSSELSDGNRHNHDDMPVLMAGSAGGALRTGVHVEVQADMGDLFLTIARAHGIERQSFGDDGRRVLTELLAG